MIIGPVLLEADHNLSEFDCSDDTLNDWLKRKALRNQRENSSRVWVVLDDDRVVAFYASSASVVLHRDATSRTKRNAPDPLPALLLGRLAVDRKYQGQGIGQALVKHFLLKAIEVAHVTAVRVVFVHAKDDEAARFYHRLGFDPSPVDDLMLMLLIKDLLASVE